MRPLLFAWAALALVGTTAWAEPDASLSLTAPAPSLPPELNATTTTTSEETTLPSLPPPTQSSLATLAVQVPSEALTGVGEESPPAPTPTLNDATPTLSPPPPPPSVPSETPPEPSSAPPPPSTSAPLPDDVPPELPSAPQPPPLDDPPPASPPDDQPPPEYLISFNEWRERYAVVAPDTSGRRAKKAAQRARQDVVGTGANGASFDGDGADFGSLFSSDEGNVGGSQIVYESARTGEGPLVVQLDAKGGLQRAVVLQPGESSGQAQAGDGSHSQLGNSLASVIQPLPNVGTGEETDPLLLLKDRSNYALFECAAMVHRSSKGTKAASSILVEKKDRYMLTPCSVEPKFVELELCDEIRIDTIVLANFEFFSSMFKTFSIRVSRNYPGRPDEWHDLGTFRARNIRGVQVFYPKAIPKSIGGFYRYMRINFLTHYGSEFYCPVSLVRVYGLTEMDAFRREDEQAKAMELAMSSLIDSDDDEELEGEEEDDMGFDLLGSKEKLWAEARGEANSSAVEAPAPPEADLSATSIATLSASSIISASSGEASTAVAPPSEPAEITTSEASSTETVPSQSSPVSPTEAPPIPTFEPVVETPTTDSLETTASEPAGEPVDSPTTSSPSPPDSPVPFQPASTDLSSPTGSDSAKESASEAAPFTEVVDPSSLPPPPPASTLSTSQATFVSSPPPASSPSPSPSSVATPTPRSVETPSPTPTRYVPRNETRHVPPPPLIPPIQQPQPGDTIYGTIMKRLTSLEQTQSLSMQYIEAQGMMLRDAFVRVDKRLGEVEASRHKHDQLLRQMLVDLEKHHSEVDRDRLALTSQVNRLTQELVVEKRLGVAQLVGLLLLFVFVGMTRGSPTTPFLHMVQTEKFRRRFSTKEDSQRNEDRRREDARSESSAEAYRKHQRTASLSVRPPASKRLAPNGGKSAPRRHYGSPLPPRTPSRSWTPPPPPSAFPPPSADDAFLSSLSTALSSPDASTSFAPDPPLVKRRSSKQQRSPRPRSPKASGGGRSLPFGLFEPQDGVPNGVPFPKVGARRGNGAGDSSSVAEEADTEPSSEGTGGNGMGTTVDEAGGEDLFEETEDDEGGEGKGKGKVEWRGPFVRPPKATVATRPVSTHGGVSEGWSGAMGAGEQHQQQYSPVPASRLPLAPPEPEGSGRRKDGGRTGLGLGQLAL